MQSKEELEGKIQEVSSLKCEKAEALHQRGQLQKRVISLQKETSDATQLHGTTAQVGEALSVHLHFPCGPHDTCAPDSAPYTLHTMSLAWVHSTEPVMIETLHTAQAAVAVTAVAMYCQVLLLTNTSGVVTESFKLVCRPRRSWKGS